MLLPHPVSASCACGANPRAHRGLQHWPQQVGRSVMLFDPPAALCGPALVRSVSMRSNCSWSTVAKARVVAGAACCQCRSVVGARASPKERACRCRVGVVAAAPEADALRRLQWSPRSRRSPAFLFREVDARQTQLRRCCCCKARASIVCRCVCRAVRSTVDPAADAQLPPIPASGCARAR
jgi:hypothetical protein